MFWNIIIYHQCSIGTVKLWLQNLTSESLTTLRSNKKFDGGIATTSMEILYKYEIAIRNEFSSMTTEIEEQNKDRIINRNLMTKLAICNMCYTDEYTCAFREYYYKGTYNIEESKEITKTYNYPIPNKILKIRQIQGYNYFSKFDCKSGFYHLKLEEESKKLTAFTVPQGFYEWNVLPFGYKNAPGRYQHFMDNYFKQIENCVI